MVKIYTALGANDLIGALSKSSQISRIASAVVWLMAIIVVSSLQPIVAATAGERDGEAMTAGLTLQALVPSKTSPPGKNILGGAAVVPIPVIVDTSKDINPVRHLQIANADNKAGTLRNGKEDDVRQEQSQRVRQYGLYALYALFFGLGIFFIHRGRLRLVNGFAGQKIARFRRFERFGHWLMASTFIVLALTGLFALYGNDILLLFTSEERFAWAAQFAKRLHHYTSFAFLAGLVMAIVFWVRDNLPQRVDLKWLITAGGIFSENGYAPAQKFNAGQKVFFWSLSLSGLVICVTGLVMMMPFQFSIFGTTFGLVNKLGFALPTNLSPLQELHFATLWHYATGFFMMLLVGVHVYFNSIGTVGSWEAMSTGDVDVNWAREHHSLWAEEVLRPDLNVDDNDGSEALEPNVGEHPRQPGSQPTT
ncbi:MAG: formate dehydrogenase subunit gamma [Hyphomicrobiaceae bacterium]